MTMNALKIILPVACLLAFSTYTFAELDEEIVTSVDASAYAVESDHPFDSLDDHEKIRHPQYIPEQDSLKEPLFNTRYICHRRQVSDLLLRDSNRTKA
ncbi:exported hypothetical protein [Acinetobacter sp. 8I-beige]|nr:exported hypothetical protein [Acinetobacter sp. 8I-beige]